MAFTLLYIEVTFCTLRDIQCSIDILYSTDHCFSRPSSLRFYDRSDEILVMGTAGIEGISCRIGKTFSFVM